MKKKQFKRSRFRIAELPQDLDPHLFFLQWLGGTKLLIEQHRGILRLDNVLIRFQTEQGVLTVSGNDLGIDVLTENRSLITGSIGSVTLEGKS